MQSVTVGDSGILSKIAIPNFQWFFFQGDRGAILTTHSMEEADALCTRVGIMVKGELRCLGSTQHLKNKYGGGYVLEIKLRMMGRGGGGPEEDR